MNAPRPGRDANESAPRMRGAAELMELALRSVVAAGGVHPNSRGPNADEAAFLGVRLAAEVPLRATDSSPAGQRRAAIRLEAGGAVAAVARDALQRAVRTEEGSPEVRQLFEQLLRDGLIRMFRGDAAEDELYRIFGASTADDGAELTAEEAAVLGMTLAAMRDGRPLPAFEPDEYGPFPPPGQYGIQSEQPLQ